MNTFEYLGGKSYKERRTDTHVYFVGGPFSQWAMSDFEAEAWPSMPVQTWSSCEKYMMAAKALLFHDVNIYEQIITVDDPKIIKGLGRQVRNFDKTIWDLNAREIVYRGNIAKFSQNADLRKYILTTEGRSFVEGAIYDDVWGVKLAFDNPAIEDCRNWKGTNWLGQVLDRVYGDLK